MKRILTSLGMLSMALAYGQEGRVGINTENPNATLEVAGVPMNRSVLDGIIAPRITGNQLNAKTYTANQTGALVYVTEAATSLTGQTINVSEVGYYYFDGNVWVRFVGGNSSASASGDNIYTADGTLAGNRIVTMNGRTLDFSGGKTTFIRNQETIGIKGTDHTYVGFYKTINGSRSAYMGFPGANATFFELNNALGDIRLQTPRGEGITDLRSRLKISNIPVEHSANNALLVTDQNGNVKKANLYQAGNGITIDPATNTISAMAPADAVSSNIYTADGALEGNRVVSEGANTLTFTGTAEGANKFINTAGTATAQKSPIQIQDGGQAQDRVLTSDADGNATWQLPKVPMEVISLNGLGYVDIPNGTNTNLYYTKIAVDVPPGKWWYTFQLAFETTADDSYRKGSTFLRLRFLDGAESNNGAATLSGTATYNGTLRQYYTTPYAYGSKYASVGIPFAGVKNILYGSLGINNTTGATKRFYVYADLMGTANAAGQGQVSNPTTRLHIGSWAETVVTRMPVQ